MSTSEQKKLAMLEELGLKRRHSVPDGFRDVGYYRDGYYQSDFVSPYTKGSCNLNSDIFVLLQDWISDEILAGPECPEAARFGRISRLPTNRRLEDFLSRYFQRGIDQVFSTNLFPFVKPGGMSAAIPQQNLVDAANDFALPQIDILKPRLVIALGLATSNALRKASGFGKQQNLTAAIDSPFVIGESKVWCQAHPGMLGQNNRNRGGIDRVSDDWQRMKQWYCSDV